MKQEPGIPPNQEWLMTAVTKPLIPESPFEFEKNLAEKKILGENPLSRIKFNQAATRRLETISHQSSESYQVHNIHGYVH